MVFIALLTLIFVLFAPGAEKPFEKLRDFGPRNVCAVASDPAGGRILWSEFVYGGTGGVKESSAWILSLDGRSGARKETRLCRVEGGKISSLDWSCRDWILFTISDSDEGVHEDRICLIDPEGGENREPITLVQRPGQSFGSSAISPDGRELAFLHYPGVNWSHDHEIWLADLEVRGGVAALGPRRITHNTYSECFCRFSSDGRSLLAVRTMDRNGSEPWGIVAFGKDGSRKGYLVEMGAREEIKTFSLSSSGLIALVAYQGECVSDEITLLDPKEKKRARLTAADLGKEWLSVSKPCFLNR